MRLRPESGPDQKFHGVTLGGRVSLSPAWSIEAALGRETGKDGDAVNLTQTGFSIGPRYTRILSGAWQGFAHLLVGASKLKASDATASAQETSFRYAPGVGVDYALQGHWSL